MLVSTFINNVKSYAKEQGYKLNELDIIDIYNADDSNIIITAEAKGNDEPISIIIEDEY